MGRANKRFKGESGAGMAHYHRAPNEPSSSVEVYKLEEEVSVGRLGSPEEARRAAPGVRAT